MSDPSLERQASEYAAKSGGNLRETIGEGQDGKVWVSRKGTAIKAFERERNYITELECYQRLKKNSITKLHGFSIPGLIGYSNDLLVIEMDLVVPPYLLDFGKVHLDNPPDFSAEVWRDWQVQREALFEKHWPEVRKLISALKRYGMHYLDAKPGNILFGDEQQD